MTELLIELFARLNKPQIRYAVLRGYEGLPYEVSHDIDLCVAPICMKECLAIVEDVMASNGYNLVQRSSRQGFTQLYYYGAAGCIKLDFWTAFKFRGLVYLHLNDVLDNTKYHNDIKVLNDSAELTVSFLKEFLHNGSMREDKIASLSRKAKSFDFLKTWPLVTSIFDDNIYRQMLINRRIDLSEYSKSFVWRLLFLNLKVCGVLKTLFSIGDYLAQFALDKVVARSFFLVLLGPDGSGKTTIAQLLIEDVNKKMSSFNECSYIHGRWGFLPNLGSLRGDRKAVVKTLDFDITQGDVQNSHSMIRASAYMIYYFFDYLIGSIRLFFSRGKNTLIVADRYFYDYFIAEHFREHPKFLVSIYTKLLPSPDLVVYLEADANVVNGRKPELSVEEIRKQQCRIEGLGPKIKKLARIDTSTWGDGIADLKNIINASRAERKTY